MGLLINLRGLALIVGGGFVTNIGLFSLIKWSFYVKLVVRRRPGPGKFSVPRPEDFSAHLKQKKGCFFAF